MTGFGGRPPVPRSALWLGLAGLIPFVWGLLTEVSPALFDLGQRLAGPRFVGLHVQVFYGSLILSFMSGVLWGFAVRAPEAVRGTCFGLSTLPAIWTFLTIGGGAERSVLALVAGFLAVLALDVVFDRHGLCPGWWLPLRVLLTACVVLCLLLGLVA